MKIIEIFSHIPNMIKSISSFYKTSKSPKSHLMIVITIFISIILMKFNKHDHSDCSSSSSSSCSCSSSSSSSCSCSTESSDDCEHHHHGCNNCETDPYENNYKEEIMEKYNKNKCCPVECIMQIVVNNQQLCIPQYILKLIYGCTDFYYTFYIPGITNQSIQSMIMLKDLLQWMTSGVQLGPDILPDGLYPIFFIYKTKYGNICCGEYLRMFVTTTDCGDRNVFITKGKDYLNVYEFIYPLYVGCNGDCPLILDLLNGNEFYTYDISETCPVSLLQFLMAFLSLLLLPECLIGETVYYDLCYCQETKAQLEYFFEYFNCDCNMSTVII